MQVLQESDLFDLRDAFRKLEEAVMASNLAAVDSAVSNLRGLMDRFQDITPSSAPLYASAAFFILEAVRNSGAGVMRNWLHDLICWWLKRAVIAGRSRICLVSAT